MQSNFKKSPPFSAPPETERHGAWVQTERKAHEAWAMLIAKKPRAAMLLHHLVAQMGNQNAVVVGQKTLAKMLNVTDRTIRSAINDLVDGKWIQVARLNGPGTVSAYIVNSSVAWGESRNKLMTATFTATVVVDAEDQVSTESVNLRKISTLICQRPPEPSYEEVQITNLETDDIKSAA